MDCLANGRTNEQKKNTNQIKIHRTPFQGSRMDERKRNRLHAENPEHVAAHLMSLPTTQASARMKSLHSSATTTMEASRTSQHSQSIRAGRLGATKNEVACGTQLFTANQIDKKKSKKKSVWFYWPLRRCGEFASRRRGFEWRTSKRKRAIGGDGVCYSMWSFVHQRNPFRSLFIYSIVVQDGDIVFVFEHVYIS